MTHTKLIEKFKNTLKKNLQRYFFYILPNPHGESLRPFDAILIYKGNFFALEFKVGKDQLDKHQQYYLGKVVESGGSALLITDQTNLDSLFDTILSERR